MHSLGVCRLALLLFALLCASVSAQQKPPFRSPLPTGVRIDPAGEAVDLGSMPINLNRILWLMLKGDVPPPAIQNHAALHALQSSK